MDSSYCDTDFAWDFARMLALRDALTFMFSALFGHSLGHDMLQ